MNQTGCAGRIFQDLEANRARPADRGGGNAGILATVLTVRYAAVVMHRIACVVGLRVPRAGDIIKQLNQVVTGADVSWKAKIGPGLVLRHPSGVVIGPESVLGRDCVLQQGVTIGGRGGRSPSGEPDIGDRVAVGAGGRLLGQIAVGDDVVVGANSVVLVDLPHRSVAVGVPARIVSTSE